MKIRNLKYYISNGIKGIKVNALMSLASISTVTACLFIAGIFYVFTANANHIMRQISSDCQLQAYMEKGTGELEMELIKEDIKYIDGVKDVTFVSKLETLEKAKKDFAGHEHLLNGLEKDVPFHDSYRIELKSLEYAEKVSSQVKKIDGILKITDYQSTANKILTISNNVKQVSIWIMLLLAIITMFIISNTVKVALFARRTEIHIMKYVGATDWFIRGPFVVEGMVIGLLGAVVGFGLICWGYSFLISRFTFDVLSPLPLLDIAPLLAAYLTVAGLLIGSLGGIVSIRRYLKV